MNRKQFLKRLLQAGLSACGVALGFGRDLQEKRETQQRQNTSPADEGWIPELEKRMITGAETPAWRKVEKAELWIKDLMGHMDAKLDRESKVQLLQACGRSCYLRAFGVADERQRTPEEREQYLQRLAKDGYEIERKGNAVTFTFSWGRNHQNPTGLIMHDGYCMCPQVESGPPGLSPSYCLCSTGYVQEIFQRTLGLPVEVELLESLKMGGEDCVFKVTFQNA
jgi:hypothetical protein